MPKKKRAPIEPEEKTSDVGGESAKAAGGYDVKEDEVAQAEDKPQTGFLDDDVDAPEAAPEKPAVSEPTDEVPATEEVEIGKPSDDFDFSPPKPRAGSKKGLWTFLIILFLLLGLGGGYYVFTSGLPGMPKTTPTPEPTVEATPTPKPELDRSQLNIQVLNGTGVAGVAKTAQDFLEELGYKVGNATNAKKYDYEETEISLKEDKMEYKDQLISDLSKKYSVSSDVTTLDESSKYDAVVTIGGEAKDSQTEQEE